MDFKIAPWAHQLEAIERAKDKDSYGLFFDMGTGKTATTIHILRHRYNQSRRILRTLIFGPPIIVRNWKREWELHSKVPGEIVHTLTGSGAKRSTYFYDHAFKGEDRLPAPGIFITNYEALLMEDLYRLFSEWDPEAVVMDESHMLKDQRAKRTKLLLKLTERAKHRYILTGTPILNSELDLFSQCLLLDRGATFGKNYFVFRARYFRDANAGMPKWKYFPNWKIMPGARQEMHDKLQSISMRVEKSECLDLPPLVRTVRHVGMTPEQGRMYKEMKKDLITFLKGEACTATIALTKALRLMQIASGFVKTVDGQELTLGATPKQEALKDLLEELTPNHKVLVWAVWKENYQQIAAVCKTLGVKYVEVHGEISDNKKDEAITALNTDPAVRVLLGHPDSAGVGCNLVAASYSVFFSRNFSLKQSLQAEARNHRGGSEIHDKITRIDIVTEGTIEELVANRLAEKQEISDEVLRGSLEAL